MRSHRLKEETDVMSAMVENKFPTAGSMVAFDFSVSFDRLFIKSFFVFV
jgi:hypothetical protein